MGKKSSSKAKKRGSKKEEVDLPANSNDGKIEIEQDNNENEPQKQVPLVKTPSNNNDVPMKKKRIYKSKESFLTTLCANDLNIEALYHILILMILVGLGYSLLKDTVEAGRPYIDLAYYVSGFGPVDMQIFSGLVWLCLKFTVLLVYPFFKLWKMLRVYGGRVMDLFFLSLYLMYAFLANYFVIRVMNFYELYPVPSLVLIVEQLRFSMKSYSFIRENAYKVLYPWHKDDTSGPAVWYQGQMSPTIGSFKQYCYFLFAPTLLYRDHYPRNPKIRWLRVFGYLVKCCTTVAFITVLTKEIFRLHPDNLQNVLLTFLTCCLWGLLYQFMAGYFFLHSFLNMFAEMFTFADREFYSDWWACTSFHMFYRKWNLIVHDWIKAYIYNDIKDVINKSWYNKIAFIPPIVISGVFHEYVLYAPVRFILPVLLVMFGILGSIFYIVRPSTNSKSKVGNFFLHFGLHFGVSFMVFCYTTEFYSRFYCPKEESFINVFVPRFYECLLRLW